MNIVTEIFMGYRSTPLERSFNTTPPPTQSRPALQLLPRIMSGASRLDPMALSISPTRCTHLWYFNSFHPTLRAHLRQSSIASPHSMVPLAVALAQACSRLAQGRYSER